MLPRHARCVLSRLRCNRHSLLLGSYLFRIARIENPSCSACGHSSQDISHLILHCPATDSLRHSLFGDSVSLRPLVQTLGSFPASGAPWSSAMPPSLGRGRVTNNNITFFSFQRQIIQQRLRFLLLERNHIATKQFFFSKDKSFNLGKDVTFRIYKTILPSSTKPCFIFDKFIYIFIRILR